MTKSENEITRLISKQYSPTKANISKTYFEDYQDKYFKKDNIAEIYHENTKLSRHTKTKLERSAAKFLNSKDIKYCVDNMNLDYKNHKKYPLPKPELNMDAKNLFEILMNRRSSRRYSDDNMDLNTFSILLYYSFGISTSQMKKELRVYPSAGALYPIEIYIFLTNYIDDLSPGVYHYVPKKHILRKIRETNPESISDLYADSESFNYTRPDLSIFLTSIFWRSYAKYGPRAYRYILQESGHICQNVQLVATALNLGSIPRAGYLDNQVNNYLGLDGVSEAVVSSISVGCVSEVVQDGI